MQTLIHKKHGTIHEVRYKDLNGGVYLTDGNYITPPLVRNYAPFTPTARASRSLPSTKNQ